MYSPDIVDFSVLMDYNEINDNVDFFVLACYNTKSTEYATKDGKYGSKNGGKYLNDISYFFLHK